jgi:hypothetical protein
MISCRVNFQSLYRLILKTCLAMDVRANSRNMRHTSTDLLSVESSNLLRFFAHQWGLSRAFEISIYLEYIFEKYRRYQVPSSALRYALEMTRAMRKSGMIDTGSSEKELLKSMLVEIFKYCEAHVLKYKEIFPQNQPEEALENTVFILRMIYKHPAHKELHPYKPDHFRDELRGMLTEGCMMRYQKLQDLHSPLDENDISEVLQGLIRLSDALCEDIEMDRKFFTLPFKREADIVRICAETYLKHYILTLENSMDLFVTSVAINDLPTAVFELFKKVRYMDEHYAKLIPG